MGRPRKDLSDLKESYRKFAEYNRRYYNRKNSEVIDGVPVGRIRVMLKNAKARAKKNAVPFSLGINDIHPPKTCPLLGIPLCYFNENAERNSPTLDRIDPERGYVPGNVWVVSFEANRAKNNLSVEQLEMLAKNLRAKIESQDT